MKNKNKYYKSLKQAFRKKCETYMMDEKKINKKNF